MPAPVIAIDVALRIPASIAETVHRLNRRLDAPPDGFHFDATHLPHISLVQQFSPADDLPAIVERVGATVAGQAPLRLSTAAGFARGTSISLPLAPTGPLDRLHRRLMNQLASFDVAAGDERAFTTAGVTPEEPARARDIAWVTRFRTEAAYSRFEPHITLGLGTLDIPAPALTFDVSQVALFALGRFCTCRRQLASWPLTGG